MSTQSPCINGKPRYLATIPALMALLLSAALTTPARAELQMQWRDSFRPAEKQQLQRWVTETDAALTALVGPRPMRVTLRFYRADGAGEPVPWANTRRSRDEGVDFHVNPALPLARFRADWTAPHELSHLVLPYLGSRNSWFAEGFASYMQYQVMAEMGVLSRRDIARRYRSRLDSAAAAWPFGRRNFVSTSADLQRRGHYPVLYWGGARYFLNMAAELGGDKQLIAVLGGYLQCCRQRYDSVDGLVQDLDRIARQAEIIDAGETPFAGELQRFRQGSGFPAARP